MICSASVADPQFGSGNVSDVAAAIRYASHQVEYRDCPVCNAPAGPYSCFCVPWVSNSGRCIEYSLNQATFEMRFVGQYEGYIRSCFRDLTTTSLAVVRGVGKCLSATSWLPDQPGGVAAMVRTLVQDGLVNHVPAATSVPMPNLFTSAGFNHLPDQHAPLTISTVSMYTKQSPEGLGCNYGKDVGDLHLIGTGREPSIPDLSSHCGTASTWPRFRPTTHIEPLQAADSQANSGQKRLTGFEHPSPLSSWENQHVGYNHQRNLWNGVLHPPVLKNFGSGFDRLHLLDSPTDQVCAAAAAAAASAATAVFQTAGFPASRMVSYLQQAQTAKTFMRHGRAAEFGLSSNTAQPPRTVLEGFSPEEYHRGMNADAQKANERERKAFERKLRNRVSALRANKRRSERYKKLVKDVGARRDTLATMRDREASLRAENERLRKIV
jgi:hypothetical protein